MTPADVAEWAGAKRSGNGWAARCPAHDDKNPSLSISEGDNGGTVLCCHAGCTVDDIVTKLGLTMKDLAPPAQATNGHHDETVYRYTDAFGNLLFEVVRKPGKQFYQRPANGRRGSGAMQGVPMVLYNLPRVTRAVAVGNTVFIVEGEKDADRLGAEDYCATTNPQGAGKWGKVRDHAREVLKGADVFVVQDKDDPGRKHAAEVVASLSDVVNSIELVEAVQGKDVSDHLAAGLTVDDLVIVQPTTKPASSDTDEPTLLLNLTVWEHAFNRPTTDAIVEGVIFPGRWTAKVAPAKVGKSTLELHIAHTLSRGIDPFTGTPRPPVDILYLDGEMGEGDIIERLEALELGPPDLSRLHYTDIFPKSDTLQGGVAIVSTAVALKVQVVILDGLNSFVTGAEKDDTPWRNLFEYTIAPLKRAGIAILSTDNTGKNIDLSARGSSTKLDKADAIIMLKRTDSGINLHTTHRRNTNYVYDLNLLISGLEGDEPISYRQVDSSWPTGTTEAAALLDRLAIPVHDGREKVRAALKVSGYKLRNDVLSAAIRYRKSCPGQVFSDDWGQPSGTGK